MWVHLFVVVAAFVGVGAGCTSEEMQAPGSPAALSSAMGQGARISFAELEHDFGEVMEDERAEYTFQFKNTGTSELEVISAWSS